ncbi:hypothetical protein DB30_01634 [Enhygromyxa salina]|uniref:Uncharacterized protein n=1 Tax=Enhygromyxa salina TaxID=215803 RepID=A0A0C1ZMN1_9BACT|nr:hypothetical protein DB30_01634 [Enhygromyxa salina]
MLAPACSTVDRGPIAQCEDDIDCGDDAVCSLALGSICVPEAPPPRTVIGLDIQEGNVRIELEGCDPEVSRQVQGTELRVEKHDSLVKSYRLRANEVHSVLNCGGSSCEDGVCDETTLTCTKPSDALLGLSMISRLGLAELTSPQKTYLTVTDPPQPEGVLPPPVEFIWPSYDSSNETAHAALRLRVTPPLEAPTRSQYQRVIAEDAEADLETAAVIRCQRAIFGNEGSVRTLAGVPVSGANVEFIHNEPIATSATVIGTGASCVDTEDCLPGWACNAAGTCGLDLTGVSAGSSVSIEDPPGALAPAFLHTYCEGIVAPVEPLIRHFRVSVTPPASTGLPNAIYSLAQGFIDPPQPGIFTEVNIQDIDGAEGLCLPNWQPPQTISFSLSGAPVPLTETELGVYACCSTECLPNTETEGGPTPPPTIETCQNFDTARFETRWYHEDLVTWAIAGCIPTASYNDGSSGGVVRNIDECPDDGCSVDLSPGELEEASRMYRVSIVQPVGSVFRSQTFQVAVDPETTSFEPFELEPRVLVRGQIACASDSDNCNAENAIFAAERLRADTDDSDLPGPFYFQGRVDATGSFVLPLDPGLYVVTAYPAVGQSGGPAPFEVLDLREGSPELTSVGGVLNAVLSKPLELDDGVLVRVQLSGFDVSTRVTPLDTGSWASQASFPPAFDLNAPLTCHGSSSRGCVIRRIRPTDTPIPLLISGRFEFTTRDRGSDQCPG